MDFSLPPPAIIIPAAPKLIVPDFNKLIIPALGGSFASLLNQEEVAAAASPPQMVTQAVSNSGGGTSSTKTATLPASLVSGNLLIMYVRERVTSNNIFTPPSGWNEIYDTNGTGLFWKQSNGAEGASTTYGGGSNRGANAVLQISGWRSSAGAAAIEFTVASGTSTNPDPPSETPSWTDPTLFVVFEGSGATTNTTAGPSGYSNFQNSKASNDPNASSATKQVTVGAAENPGIFTNAGSQSWTAITLAVRAA